MKLMIINSEIKHKSKAMLGLIKNLVLDFILYFVIASKKYLIHVTAQRTTQNTLYITCRYITCRCKKYFMANNLQQ